MPQIADIRLPVIQLVKVSVDYRGAKGNRPVLSEVSVGFPERTLTAVVGPSGAGKSTLLRCASGLERPSQGKVFRGSRELDAMDEQELTAFRSLFVPQQPELLPALTTYENVAQASCITGLKAQQTAIMETLRQVGLEDEAGQKPAELSAEQQKRVTIARSLVTDPEILFVDEPADSLDHAGGRRIMNLLRAMVEQGGRTVVMVTRDPAVAACADRVVFLVGGRVVGKIDWPTADEVAAELARQQP
ncbi:ABC transporter ATP-binding protein [Streptomyces tagetis]|uniref:ATP-binding cassette domain-containing protein n=1 Tax=Streptomyces tagetis TaxID=2820809 RepID=A0A940XBV4_9ACTN|nr:ATP-binding cassette domain-containing protein [Streptomyces sp. RG38]MBQ0825286.1 ATP-binding cassette domain-containing protein [Streptomyces sp. RG38]